MRIGTKSRVFLSVHGLVCLVLANSSLAQQIKTLGEASKASTKVATDAEERTAKDGWVPPDIDVRPPVAKEATCALQDVISKAGMQVEEFADNLNRLTARETIQTQTVSRSGTLHHPEIQRAEYVVSASQDPDGNVHFEEYRSRSMNNAPEPSSDHVAVVNAFSLLLIFHPYHAKDFQMSCEGLGNWHGQPAWQIRFEEQSGHMSASGNKRKRLSSRVTWEGLDSGRLLSSGACRNRPRRDHTGDPSSAAASNNRILSGKLSRHQCDDVAAIECRIVYGFPRPSFLSAP
jgi:hypothetical protein